jgi:hypothetical protein
MSTDFSSKERQFVADLEVDTGRDLAAWMTAITSAGLSHRNEIIDWLRPQGFTFARASWIERIHHNGGNLIYGQQAPKAIPEAVKRKSKGIPPSQNSEQAVGLGAPERRLVTLPDDTARSSDGDIDTLLAAAKAYRPLAQALVRDILAAVPGADARAVGALIVFSFDQTFAAVAPTAKDIRLMLPPFSAANGTWGEGWQAGKPPALFTALTRMLILTDARQLTTHLRVLIAQSAKEMG